MLSIAFAQVPIYILAMTLKTETKQTTKVQTFLRKMTFKIYKYNW